MHEAHEQRGRDFSGLPAGGVLKKGDAAWEAEALGMEKSMTILDEDNAQPTDHGNIGPYGSEENISSPDMVVRSILRGIFSGRYVPGQRLIEADLTRELKVSRGPVREALKRLAAERTITLTRHRGAYIRALTRTEVRDLLRVIEALTGLAARLAARGIEQERNYVAFEAAYRKLMAQQDRGDSFSFIEERNSFYRTMIAVGGNSELPYVLPITHIQLIRTQFYSYTKNMDRDRQFREYKAISEAILAGDARRADRLTRLHVRGTRIALMRLPDEAFAAAVSS